MGIRYVADRIEAYLPEAENTLSQSLHSRSGNPAAAAAGAAADRMLAGLRHLAEASRPTPRQSTIPTSTTAPPSRNFTARADAPASLRAPIQGAP